MTDPEFEEAENTANADARTAASATKRAADAATRARAKAAEAAERAREAARDAADRAREKGRKARASAGSGIENHPLVAVAGGIAIGAILAGLLPRTAAEDRAVGKVGTRIRSSAREAVKTAKTNAKTQLDELGLNADSAREKISGIAGKVAKAATAAGTAAAESAIKKKS